MEKYLWSLAGGIFLYSYAIYCWHKLMGKKVDLRNINVYIAFMVLLISGTLIQLLLPQSLKMIVTIISLILVNYCCFCRKLDKCVASVVIFEAIAMFSELLFVLFVFVAVGDMSKFMERPVSYFIVNFFVAVLSLLTLKTNVPNKLFCSLVGVMNKLKKNILILCSIITILLSSLLMSMSYMQLPNFIILILNSALLIIYFLVIIKLAGTQENLKNINSKYETSLSSLREYEGIMNKYRVSNHENKNQMLTIRNMIDPSEKAVIKYIDTIVDNKLQDNEVLFYKTAKLPEGGLRATIYSGLCKMDKKGIDYILDIANDVKVADLIDLNDKTMLNACKVLGVFLDNSIEAVENLDKKNIVVEVFIMDNYLCVDISNNYSGKIEMGKLDRPKYTTKGEGHGYGLTLVNELVSNDDLLENEKLISKDCFTQRLKINMMKDRKEKNVES